MSETEGSVYLDTLQISELIQALTRVLENRRRK